MRWSDEEAAGMLHYRLHRDPTSSHQQLARLVRRLAQGPVLDVTVVPRDIGPLPYGRGADEWRLARDVMGARRYPVIRGASVRTGATL